MSDPEDPELSDLARELAARRVGRGPAEDDREPRDPIERLRHREVIVRAGGITYRGILLGADEDEIYLKTSLRHVTVRMDRVSQLVAADEEERFSATKQIDPTFYDLDDLDPPTDDEDGA